MRILFYHLIVLFFWSNAIFAQNLDILPLAQQLYYKDAIDYKFGVESEFLGLTLEQSGKIVSAAVNGKLSIKENGNFRWVEIESPTAIYYIEPETNETTYQGNDLVYDYESTNSPLEFITSPIHTSEIDEVVRIHKALKNAGAKGTGSDRPFSTQVTVELVGTDQQKVDQAIMILRNYLKPIHRQRIQNYLKPSEVRIGYIHLYSDGLMKKILDPTYAPTPNELLIDFVYRQTLELLGEEMAWTANENQVRKRMKDLKYPFLPRVAKLNVIRLTSLLADLFPNDPMVKIWLERDWVSRSPTVEFRERNNRFSVEQDIKETLGFVEMSRKLGNFDYDAVVNSLSGTGLGQNLINVNPSGCHDFFN